MERPVVRVTIVIILGCDLNSSEGKLVSISLSIIETSETNDVGMTIHTKLPMDFTVTFDQA